MRQIYLLQRFVLLIVLLVSSYSSAQSNTKSYCDSLIKRGNIALEKYQHTYSMELLFEANTLAKKNTWSEQEFQSLNSIGTNYYRLSEFGEALRYYLQAYTIAIKKLKPKDEITVLNNIAILYFEDKKFKEAIEYFTKVYRVAKDNNENLIAGRAAINLGTVAVETNNLALAKKRYNDAIPLLIDNQRDIVLAKGGIANCELLLGNTRLARQSALYLLATTKDLKYYHADVELMMIIAKSYLKENNLDQASEYITKIFSRKPNLEMKIKLFKLLTEIYTRRKSFELALHYKDSLFDATAKVNTIRNEKLFENSKIKFELQNYKNQSLLNETKLINERKTFYYVLLFVVIIVLFIIGILRNRSLKLKQKQLIAERNEQMLALELEKEKRESLQLEKQFNENQAESLLQQEKLKNEVKLKNRKLSAKALYLSGRNELIETILSELAVLPQVSKDKALLAHIASLKNQLKSDNEWDNFITHFEEVNQGFLTALQTKHPALSTSDIRYISYLYMNLSTKEIASMLNITQDSCRKRKERVLSKMQLSKEVNLYDYLTAL